MNKLIKKGSVFSAAVLAVSLIATPAMADKYRDRHGYEGRHGKHYDHRDYHHDRHYHRNYRYDRGRHLGWGKHRHVDRRVVHIHRPHAYHPHAYHHSDDAVKWLVGGAIIGGIVHHALDNQHDYRDYDRR